jgi:hypothetical protein
MEPESDAVGGDPIDELIGSVDVEPADVDEVVYGDRAERPD